ncbi:redox-sensitive transcriptional activator SoxR [Vibrio parahaemolyticus]|uniref:redox-sensitive transcriptional activator SoxR n=1 Tax=Vibrio parahaemolyticus TaxID=670 RepID=UPI00084A9575|nr:redox-sensitive transcriptional activator SoxR [Vibrio parahaemolyticus]PWF70616.1 redox-sensitive transcriptional activator SoxR [Vibrio sp. T21]EHK9084389.1 redox-sensitive transcriptional activator SoxR [Vibrio parahaemolyticus]EHZ2780481.1 redox-sensitive transcriptional activator SoxR [Vibrio parahaemolyticus]EJG2019139.1 redox-sensitive transcriptional activator SoxR [Vibrio parahaemolyticus]EKK9971467.1 redox-sensitive transcriptional activator SoxR [Vibrio parahaemolyticus]
MEISVGEVAKRSGVKVSALHFYEQKGLISSWRNQGNQRRYHRSVLRRVAVIKAAQQVGLSLEEIKHALDELPKHQAPNKEQWEVMASHWHEQLEQKIQKLKALQNDLGGCIGCGCLSLETCALRNPEDVLGKDHSGSNLILEKGA